MCRHPLLYAGAGYFLLSRLQGDDDDDDDDAIDRCEDLFT